jgi:hypothetical protein
VAEDDRMVQDSQREPGMWKLISGMQVCKGYGGVTLDKDHVFSEEGEYLTQGDRNLTELSKMDDGFIIWGEYVKSRMVGVGMKRKRSKK